VSGEVKARNRLASQAEVRTTEGGNDRAAGATATLKERPTSKVQSGRNRHRRDRRRNKTKNSRY